jgi:hypothetical protein
MNKKKIKEKVLVERKSKLILSLNTELYKPKLIKKAVKDSGWIERLSNRGKYLQLEIEPKDKNKALDLANYILYLSRVG